jgi:DNA-binding MarR family transcriptional regulator
MTTKKKSENQAPTVKGKPADGSLIFCPPTLQENSRLMLMLELLFFGHTALSEDAESVLCSYGYGRAHHRALYFVARQPGLTSNALADVLRISNQALSKVMGTLLHDGILRQDSERADRRVKRWQVTPEGYALLKRISEAQFVRLKKAVETVKSSDSNAYISMMEAMLEPEVQALLTPH